MIETYQELESILHKTFVGLLSVCIYTKASIVDLFLHCGIPIYVQDPGSSSRLSPTFVEVTELRNNEVSLQHTVVKLKQCHGTESTTVLWCSRHTVSTDISPSCSSESLFSLRDDEPLSQTGGVALPSISQSCCRLAERLKQITA